MSASHTHTHTQSSLQSRLEKVGLNALIRFRRSDDECRRLSAKNNDSVINVLHEGSFVFIRSDFSPRLFVFTSVSSGRRLVVSHLF